MITLLRLFVLTLAAALAGCGSGSLSTEQGDLRLVNATSDQASLDLFANGTAVVTGVAPLTSSGYGNVDKNSYSLDVRVSGAGTALVTTSTTIGRKEHQTVVVSSSGGALSAQVLGDEEGDPGSGFAKVRIFNTATADVGAVDVYFVAGGCASLATSGAAAVAANVSGLQSAYRQVASSTTPVHVCVTSPGDKTDLRLDIPSLTLSEKRIVTIILVRTTGGFFLNGLVLDQQGALGAAANGSARVRVAASLAAPAAPVTVEVNGTTVATGLPTQNVGPYQTVSSGTLTIKINGTTIAQAPPLSAGADVTLLLTGTTPTVTLIADDNAVSSSAARPVKIRLVNGLNGSTGPATLTVDNAPVGNGASSPGASAYAFVPASAALARIEARSGVVQLYLANNVTLTSGRVYTLFLLGDVASAPNTGFLIADR